MQDSLCKILPPSVNDHSVGRGILVIVEHPHVAKKLIRGFFKRDQSQKLICPVPSFPGSLGSCSPCSTRVLPERFAQRRTQKSGIGGISRARELYSWLEEGGLPRPTGRGVVTTSQAPDLVSAAPESRVPSARTVKC